MPVTRGTFKKGHPKVGGVKKGGITLKSLTRSVAEHLADARYDPIDNLQRMAADPKTPASEVRKINDVLSRYVHPVLQSVQVQGPAGGAIEIAVTGLDVLKSRIDRVAEKLKAK